MNPAGPGARDGSVVASKRLGQESCPCWAMLEDMGDTNSGWEPLDPGFLQLQVGCIAEPDGIEPLSLSLGHITGSRAAFRIRVLVVPDQRLPVRVTRPLDRLPNFFPGEWHRPS